MTVSATVPQAVPCVNLSPIEAARLIARSNAISFSEVAARMALLSDTGYAGIAAQIQQAALALSLEEHRTVLAPIRMTSSDFRKLGAESFAQWQHSRLAPTTTRRRKTVKTCKVCIRMGRPCSWHQGGAK